MIVIVYPSFFLSFLVWKNICLLARYKHSFSHNFFLFRSNSFVKQTSSDHPYLSNVRPVMYLSQMCFQIIRSVKSFATFRHFAMEWLFAWVRSHVTLHVLWSLERRLTKRTIMHLLWLFRFRRQIVLQMRRVFSSSLSRLQNIVKPDFRRSRHFRKI